jgi:hypothetical protein
MDTIKKYDRFELELEGPSSGNPYRDVELWADFTLGHRVVSVRGFYDGDGRYKVRFMPDAEGEWSYRTRSSLPALDDSSGRITVVGAKGHGPVQVVGSGFAHADGTPFVPVGTTCYAWVHQSRELRDQTVRTLSDGPFNKIRMCVFPKDYRYNQNEPDFFAFPGSLADGFQFDRFNPTFFEMFEEELSRLAQLGIQADIILFHPYDRWGFQALDPVVERAYLEYVTARWASFDNVWWSMANEWDLMKHKTVQDFHRYFQIVQQEDPYNHLRSVHNCRQFYDHALPWVTHSSIQRSDTEHSRDWLQQYGKPVVIDECCYEGDIPEGWGNISARELLRRQWTAVVNGGWPGAHGETYYNDEEILWWSKGGKLIGDAPARINFLREILEDAPIATLSPSETRRHPSCLAAEDEYLLYYLGFQQASWKPLTLPEGKRYQVDVIDTWDMTITTLDGTFEETVTIPLPGKEYMAIRARAV